MKRLAVVLVLFLSASAFAQSEAPAKPGAERFSQNKDVNAVNYSDIYCSGFITNEKFSRANHVTGGLHSPHSTKFADREYVYLTGGGYTVGSAYYVIRQVQDINKFEIFPGETKELDRLGGMYADIAHVRVTYLEGKSAVAAVEFACQPISPGDVVVPFKERPAVSFKTPGTPFQIFQRFDGGPSGRIVMGKDFNQFLGAGQKVYVNIGANKGVHPGDYLRITRNYDFKDMAPIDQISVGARTIDETQKNAPKVGRADLKDMPYHGLGEMIVLNVTDTTATGMITLALEDIQPGDVVEPTRR